MPWVFAVVIGILSLHRRDHGQRQGQRQRTGVSAAHEALFGEEVVEGFYGGEFVVFDVEDGVELGDIEEVFNFFGEA